MNISARSRLFVVVLSFTLITQVSFGQAQQSTGSTGASAMPTTTMAPNMSDPSFRGSVSQGTASSTAIPLSLSEALDRGLKANLGLLVSDQASRESRAMRLKALSGLLPRVTGQIAATEQQINLQALGFNVQIPPSAGFSIPTIVGPFGYQTAQASAQIPLFDWTAINNFRGAKENLRAANLSVKNARDLVVLGVGNGYLQIISDAARITATQAQIDADAAVLQNAERRHDAGTAIAIDVTRSQVELKGRQQALIAAKNQFAKDKLALGRAIGLPPGQDFAVTDPSPAIPLAAMSTEDALKRAYDNRSDYLAAKSRVAAARFTLRAAKGERYPVVAANGYYGATGLQLFSNSHGVFTATGSVTFNIFDGGRIRGDIMQSDAELMNRQNELNNLRGEIDNDVRTALLDLNSAQAQVDVAKSNLDLANESLGQSKDRFGAGVTNTVEVVQSQQQVASANENLISAQYQYNLAKVELARAMGVAEQGVKTYFDSQKSGPKP